MKLESVYRHKSSVVVLYHLLEERTKDQSISHKGLPSYEQHKAFVEDRPYQAWYLIIVKDVPVGAVYLTKQREIGIFIFKAQQGKGYGKQAVEMLMAKWPGRFLANINPQNTKSIAFFKKLGAVHIQNTYEIGGLNGKSK